MGSIEKTQAELLAIMDAEQANIPALAGVKSASQVAFLTHLKKLFATLWQYIAALANKAIADIMAVSAQYQIGTLAWYVEQAKAFQFGYSVIVENGRVGYAQAVPEARIIAQAAAVESPATSRLLIKAVKRDNSGLVPLSADELAAFKDYMAQVKWAGIGVDVVSLPADELKLTVRVQVDPKVLSNTGASLLNPTIRPVPAAIQTYLQNLPFDGVFGWMELTDYMQKIPGVIRFDVLSSSSRDAGSTTWVPFTAQYATRAGHVSLILSESTFTYV